MEKENLSVEFRKLLKLDVIRHTRSWDPVFRNDWIIKFSVYKGFILLFFTSSVTGQTIIRYFDDEDIACEFINYILHQNASENVKP